MNQKYYSLFCIQLHKEASFVTNLLVFFTPTTCTDIHAGNR